jgi:hypothetical protein
VGREKGKGRTTTSTNKTIIIQTLSWILFSLQIIKMFNYRYAWYFTPVILATWEVEIARIEVWDQPRQKVRAISTNKLEVVVHACDPNYAGGIGRRITVHASQGRNARPCLKNKA